MADICEDHPALNEARTRLWSLIEKTPFLDWQLLTKRPENYSRFLPEEWLDKPQSNVWLGATVENQEYANIRIPILARVPATLRWLSVEPLLGRMDIIRFLQAGVVDWIIVGGESGANYRPLDIDSAEHLREQCEAFKVPYFFKQIGGKYSGELGHLLNGVEYHEFPEVKCFSHES
jgi:protein gp37